MDRTSQDMKRVGFFGIFKHSFKIIFKSTKIFAQIALTLILPLAIVFLAHIEITNRYLILSRIKNNEQYFSIYLSTTVTNLLYYILFKIVYLTLLAVFCVLSTATIVFTVVSVYTDRDVVFKKVMTLVVPNIWKKIFITFVTIYFTLFIYNAMYAFVLAISQSMFTHDSVFRIVVVTIIRILLVFPFLYLTIVWQLASVVTVLEKIHGFKALKKGKRLASGKIMVGMGIAFVLYGFLYGIILTVYILCVEHGNELYGDDSGLPMIWRVMIGILCGILVMMVFLLFIVTQTVLYLVCKSYHQEAIDKLSLSTFLSAYIRETMVNPKTDEEIQLERPQPQPLAQQV
ncbi:uncharacterized protein LOC143555698 [Bidens hawaiensis]|uniref:uncharacterized protein LOC143555698 n=1 Tax=Bidens hawaiensis TaxID=980011 RepID=UPI00404A63CB